MLFLVVVLLLVLVLGGAGFALHMLWWVALVVLALWVLGFLLPSGGRGGGRRWYRW